MRCLGLGLIGLTGLSLALPTGDEPSRVQPRQFHIGPVRTVSLWYPKPTQTSSFHIGRDEPDQLGTPIKRSTGGDEEAAEQIIKTCAALAKRLDPSSHNPAYRFLIEECFLLFKKYGIEDFTILDAWSEFGLSDKVKRTSNSGGSGGAGDKIIIGSCTEDDVKDLVTQYRLILAHYGRQDVPYDVGVLLESIKAALFYCALASPTTGGLIPDTPVPGGSLEPDDPVDGGSLEPDDTIDGGGLEPDDTVDGGDLEPDDTVDGGKMEPDEPVKGGDIKPSD